MLSGGRRERNQHRRTHELQQHSSNQARVAAERADMEARWRREGKLFDPRHAPVFAKRTAGFAVQTAPKAELTFLQMLAHEPRTVRR